LKKQEIISPFLVKNMGRFLKAVMINNNRKHRQKITFWLSPEGRISWFLPIHPNPQ
jgi:hypothetical protein